VNKLNIKPLSVNKVWQGKRFRTKDYDNYELAVRAMLPKIGLPDAPYEVNIFYGFSSKAADIDNPSKPFIDILQKHYGFNDKEIFKLTLVKEIVKKGQEYIEFEIMHYV